MHVPSLPAARPWRRALAATLFLLAGAAQGASLDATALSGVPPDSASAGFSAPGLPDLLLTVQQSGGASMVGSDLFGFEGLWLGSDGLGGTYRLLFSQPVQELSLSFIALTRFGGGLQETLDSFATNAPSTADFVSPDGSATWANGVATPLEEDARGVLRFISADGTGFSTLDFRHQQPEQLQGVVLDRIDFLPATPVPEPAPVLLWGAALAVWAAVRRRRSPLALGGSLLLMAACGGAGDPGAGGTAGDATAQTQALAVGATATSTTLRDAVRLADQASFGATEPLVASIRAQGVEAWLASQLAATGSRYTRGEGALIHTPQVDNFCLNRADTCYRDWFSSEPLLWDFYRNALTQPDQLRQRVAFALGQILVVSEVEVQGTYGLRNYHNMLLDNAFGSYRELLRRVTLSPVMGDYLDHVNNDRFAPNENFARELLQLFAIGTCRLNPDGSLAGGRCNPTYDNTTVRNYAFALTGWTYPDGGSAPWDCGGPHPNCTFYGGDMVARQSMADDQPRSLLGGVTVPATRTPAQALNTVLDSLMAHPNMAPFIGRQMIQHLVKSNPSPAYVRRVANAFNSGRYAGATRSFGAGTPGDMAATVAAVLLDTEARNSAPPLVAEKLREPVLMMTGFLRAMNGRSDGAALGWWWGAELRQQVFRSPSVFNFYPPDYPLIGTRLVGPAFGVYNLNTAFARLNFLNQMVYWGGADPDASIPQALGTQIDTSAFLSSADDPAALVDRLADLATGGRMGAASRRSIVQAVSAWDASQSDDWRAERVRSAAYLVFASPAYQVLN